MTCSVRVVLPELSGPYISTTRPRGKPPIPKAISSPSDPVEIAGMASRGWSPIFMTEPLPNWRSIWVSAALSAFFLLSSILPPSLSCLFSGGADCIFEQYYAHPSSPCQPLPNRLRKLPITANSTRTSPCHSQGRAMRLTGAVKQPSLGSCAGLFHNCPKCLRHVCTLSGETALSAGSLPPAHQNRRTL